VTTPAPRRLIDLQARQVEVGRIRLGTSTPKTSKAGRTYNDPVKLDRFRLTSRSATLILQAADIYGGTPEPWQPQNGGATQHQVIIEATSLRVVVPPNPVSQFYEVWEGARCKRRCDGQTELLSAEPCLCGPDPTERLCKPTTRLQLMLSELPGIGVWRLESHGYYAAVELPAVADLLSTAGGLVPARLEMEERHAQVPKPRSPGETMTARFMVPVLHVEATPAQLLSSWDGTRQAVAVSDQAAVAATPDRPALPAGAAPVSAQPISPAAAPAEEQWSMDSHQYAAAWSRIRAAEDEETLEDLRSRIERSPFDAEAAEKIRRAWSNRVAEIAYANHQTNVAVTQTGTEPARPAVPPPAPALDRSAVWMQLNMLAGQRGMSAAQLRAAYQSWDTSGRTLGEVPADEMDRFRQHLEAQQ
jgi:hypothetical protein